MRLGLPFRILSDAEGAFSAALELPNFMTGGTTYLKRLTLLIAGGRIETLFYPVIDPAGHVAEVLCEVSRTEALKSPVLGVLDRVAEAVECLFEIVGEERHAEEILIGAIGALGPRRGERFFELFRTERWDEHTSELQSLRHIV